METSLFSGETWLAVLRIGVGLWWLESWRHKDKTAWFRRGSGISWAASVAEKHRWAFVRTAFERTVAPRPKAMSYIVVFAELAIGLGLVFGFLTPVAALGGLVLNIFYFVLMIHDWGEQGQNSMMAVMEIVVLGAHGWQTLSLDDAFGLF
ncbi:MAG: DoxX family protein [Acidimicrobiia bacterium]|nr:DoxX family protein [Acidimicrobiia bacterium]